MKLEIDRSFVDNYSLVLLNWAKAKTSDSMQAEELVQNVWTEFFHAVKLNEDRGIEIQKPENFLWKIAHYVWCSLLNAKKSFVNNSLSIENSEMQIEDKNSNFEKRFIEDEENKKLINYMRKTVMKLDFLQREILISFYIDGKSQKEIAEKLNISVSTVKWHLFDTRTKLKEEITAMEKINESSENFIYRPGHLNVGVSGDAVPEIAVSTINESLSKQNICIACYKESKTLDELVAVTGIPKPYIEADLRWLVENEFVAKNKNSYSTIFEIQNNQNLQDIYGYYLKCRSQISDVITSELLNAEDRIRKIGFYGSDSPMNKLLWFLIYFTCSEFTAVKSSLEMEKPVRTDGGKYFPIGFDYSKYDNLKVNLDTSEWGFNGPMTEFETDGSGNFLWFGMYNFDSSEIIDIAIDQYKSENKVLEKLLKDVLLTYDGKEFHFSTEGLNDGQKESIALLVKKGFVRIENNSVLPCFCVFTKKQMEELKVIVKEIENKVSKSLYELKSEFEKYYEKNIPSQVKYLLPLFVMQALNNLGWITTILSFNEKKLFVPATSSDGEFLTLAFTKY